MYLARVIVARIDRNHSEQVPLRRRRRECEEKFSFCLLGYFLTFIHVVTFIYFPQHVSRELCCFHFLAILNNTNMNICVRTFAWTCFQFCWVYI